MKMKVDTRFGSIWDELPYKSERKIPETQAEAMDFYEAAQSSVNNSLMKTWDSHNDMVKKSAELRKISERKKVLEHQAQQRREENRERVKEAINDSEKRREEFKAEASKRGTIID